MLSFKFKHGNGNTPNRKECQRIQNKTIQHVLREGSMEKIRHLQMIPEQHKLSMDGAPVACSCRRETEVISNIVKEVTHSLPFFQC